MTDYDLDWEYIARFVLTWEESFFVEDVAIEGLQIVQQDVVMEHTMHTRHYAVHFLPH